MQIDSVKDTLMTERYIEYKFKFTKISPFLKNNKTITNQESAVVNYLSLLVIKTNYKPIRKNVVVYVHMRLRMIKLLYAPPVK